LESVTHVQHRITSPAIERTRRKISVWKDHRRDVVESQRLGKANKTDSTPDSVF